ncbi:MAG: pitrilysin family protein [Chthoniobacteraceae bacterium]|nr:pitrilysin family protein [Chthoniobacteraceae bacterium]
MIDLPPSAVRQWTLPNGLGILVEEDHSAPVASVQAWCETGSIHEDRWLGAGLSHILEHMLFKGTATRGPNVFAQSVHAAGGMLNAYTSFDRTVYWIDLPSAGVPIALDLLGDALQHAALPEEEYAKEQEVIRREFAMCQDDPDRMSSLLLFANAFRRHPYRHPVIGHLDIYNRLTRDDVLAYYRARYVPNNLFFVVTGDVAPQAVHDQLAAAFANAPRRPLAPVFIPEEPPQTGRREEHVEFPSTELTRLELAWHIPALTHPDIPALDLLALILGDGRSSRLNRRIREELALVHGISAWCYTPGHPGLFGIEALADPSRREAALAEIFAVMGRLQSEGVTPAELEKARAQALSSQLSSLVTTRGRASDIGSNWLLTRNPGYTRDYFAALQRVTPADVARVAAAYCTEANLTVTSLNPPGTLPPPARAAAAAAAGAVRKFTLSNGLTLLVREDPRLPLVSAVACFKGGLLAESPETSGIGRLHAHVLPKGTVTRTAPEIAEAIEALGGSIGAESGNHSFAISLRTLAPHLAAGLEILGDILVHPGFPEAEIAREKEAQLAALKAEEEEPTSLARILLRRTLYPGHPYGLRPGGTPGTVAGLDREKLAAFHQRFAVGRNGVVAIFGAVNAEEVRALAEQAFGALPAGEPAHAAPPAPAPLSDSQTVTEHKAGEQAILMAGYRGIDMRDPRRYALELIEEASSDLGSRFFLRIREKMGLAYFVGASQVQGLVPGPFVFYLGTAPAKVEAVQAELLDEIRVLATEGLAPEELARAKAKLLGQEALRKQSNDALAYSCALDELYGLGYDEYTRLRERIEAVTQEDVRAAAQALFGEAPRIVAVVRP